MGKGTQKRIQHSPRDRGVGRSSRPLHKGVGGSRCPKICFRFGLKIEGKGPGPQGPSPGSASILVT